MKYFLFFILSLICSVFYCNAQDRSEKLPFINVPISVNLNPAPVTKKLSKKENKSFVEDFSEKAIESFQRENRVGFNLSIDFRVDYFRLPDGKTATLFTAQIENKQLAFKNTNQIGTASVEVYGQITSPDKKMDGIFEDRITFSANTADLKSSVLTGNQSYIKGILLPQVFIGLNLFCAI